MNKYQEALNNVKIAPSFMGGNIRYTTALESSIPFLEDIDVLQQLVDKETPMKTVGVSMNGRNYGFCERCGKGIHLAQRYDEEEKKWIKKCYCFHCGQKLDWSDECE